MGPVAESAAIVIDAKGMTCPMPLLKAKQALNAMAQGEILQIEATDPGSVRDFAVFSAQSGHLLLASEEVEGVYIFSLKKT